MAGGLLTAAYGAMPNAYQPDRILIQPKAGMAASALTTWHLKAGTHLVRTFPGSRHIPGCQVIQLPPGESPERWAKR
ncbi:MAG TPA: hypothetical protein VF607_00470, partial [Verrucomicrobiae bacterium]